MKEYTAQTHGRERGRRRNGIQNSKEKMETREGNKVETEETHNTLPFETVQAGGWQGMGTRHREKTGGSQSALSPTAGQGAGGGGGCTVLTVSGPVCERTLGNEATPEGHRRGGQGRREGDGFLRVQGSVLSNLTEPHSHGPGPRVTDDLPSPGGCSLTFPPAASFPSTAVGSGFVSSRARQQTALGS